MIIPYGDLYYEPEQRNKFRSGELWQTWAEQYPFLFDEIDRGYAKHQAPYGYFFVEWLGAILIYHATGYLSLQGSYHDHKQKVKSEILQKTLSKDVYEIIDSWQKYKSQPPDLFIYASDYSDYFFCEVKGPGDRISITQSRYFHELENVCGKRVYKLRLKKLNLPTSK